MSDVIFHVRYTARDGGDALRDAAREGRGEPATGARLFDARADFGTEWYRFKNPEAGQDPVLTLDLGDEHFPFHSPDDSVLITSVELVGAVDSGASPLNLGVKVGTGPKVLTPWW